MNLESKLNDNFYRCKNIAFEMLDLDEGSRKVKGRFASFDTLDSDNDVIRKGAFKKSIQEWGVNSGGNRKIAHLRNHDWDRQIGKLDELFESEKGLDFVSVLGRSDEGRNAFLDYQDGILIEHSIGFNYIKDKIKFVENSSFNKDGHFEVLEVKLWEGSGVTFGANSLTPVLDVAKGEDQKEITLKKLNELSDRFYKILRDGKGTDERLENIEAMFKQIQQLQNSLAVKEPSVKDTLKSEPIQTVNHKFLLSITN